MINTRTLQNRTSQSKSTLSVTLLLAAFILSGCVTNATPKRVNSVDPQAIWNNQKVNNNGLSSWSLKGKIGVKSGSKGGSATLNWSYQGDQQNIELYGPFGGGRVHITTTADSAELKDTKGQVLQGETAQDVLYQRLGWHVPFEELIMWSRGLPNEGATDIVIDESGYLQSLDQGIWHVEYQEYRAVDKYTLPRKLTITSLPGKLEIFDKNGKYIGDEFSVKVVLKRWWDIASDS